MIETSWPSPPPTQIVVTPCNQTTTLSFLYILPAFLHTNTNKYEYFSYPPFRLSKVLFILPFFFSFSLDAVVLLL